MRTTVTLDADVARMLDEEVHRARFRVQVHAAKCIAGFDGGRLNALADELEDAANGGKVNPLR